MLKKNLIELVKHWKWGGRELHHPLGILKRVLMLPPLYFGAMLLYLALWVGWDKETASEVLQYLP